MSDVSPSAVDQLLRERRSIRRFHPTAVEPEIVDQVLAAALWAPSPHHSQPWRLVVLRDPAVRSALARAMAGRLADELRLAGANDLTIAGQTERSLQRIVGAPAAVLCSVVGDGLRMIGDARLDRLEWEMAVQSVGAFMQSLFLAAHARGLGSCWMAAPMYCADVVRTVLDLPITHEPQALVLLGYPADEGRLRPRRPLDDMVTYR